MSLQSWLAAHWQPLFIGVLLGLILGWLVFGLRSRSRQRQLEADLQTADAKLANSEKALADARKQLQTAQANFGDADASLSQARERLLAWQTGYRSLEEELAAVQAELAGLKEGASTSTPAASNQVSDLQQQVSDLQTLLAGAQAARAEMDEELAAAQSMLAQGSSAWPAELSAAVEAAPVVEAAGETGLLAAQTLTGGVEQAPTQLTTAPTFTHRLQALTLVKGIGSVFQQRLYEGGVGTFWQLANLPDEAMRSILRLGGVQARSFGFDAIRADAHRLAQESDTLGLTWQGARVDDFEPLLGLGPIFEQRLYEAGICTFEDMIEAGPEKLAAIVQAPAMNPPDFDAWIDAAQKTLTERGAGSVGPSA